MDNLEEDLTCSVCYSLFTDPRVLPCSHTFCKGCLEKVLQVSVNFSIWRPLRLPLKCPNCRSLSELPTNGVDALPVNVSLRSIVEKFQRDNQPRAPTCPEHLGQPLNVFCVQDCELICGFCLTVGQHRGHAIDDPETAYVKERDTPAKLIERLTDGRWKEVCKLVEQLEQEKVRNQSLVRQNREDVDRYFRELECLLAHKKDSFMKSLDRVCGQLACTFNPLIDKLKDMEEEQLELISLSTSMEEEKSPLVFLEKVQQLKERVDALTRTPLPDVPSLRIAPSGAGDFLEQHWTDLSLGRLQDAPVPKFSCYDKGRGVEAAEVKPGQTWFAFQLQALTTVTFLGGLLFLLLLFFLNPVGGASFGFSVLSQISQGVECLVSKLTSPIHEFGMFLYCLLRDGILKVGSCVSALGQKVYQYVAFLCKMLDLC